jgi:hypothetical protein
VATRKSGKGRAAARRGRAFQRNAPPRTLKPEEQSFTCVHCGRFVGPLSSGGRNRNHCPYCLYSRHVDAERSGDRASTCRGPMVPVGAFQRPNGEHVLVHRCERCGFERFNRIQADDDFDLVLSLPVVPPRSVQRADSGSDGPGQVGGGGV